MTIVADHAVLELKRHFDAPPQQVFDAWLSRSWGEWAGPPGVRGEVLTLEPGDVILMGTPAGVGQARNPPVWMKAGDTIEIDIEKVGTLRNPIANEAK